MKKMNLEEFKAWARANCGVARAVCLAQAVAECERERVDAYILPIFKTYGFRAHRDGRVLTTPDELYLTDDARCPHFFAECDVAHRAHGFTGPAGHCPALAAEHLHIEAENALLELGAAVTGVAKDRLHGENRAKMLKLLLGACLKAEEETTA